MSVDLGKSHVAWAHKTRSKNRKPWEVHPGILIRDDQGLPSHTMLADALDDVGQPSQETVASSENMSIWVHFLLQIICCLLCCSCLKCAASMALNLVKPAKPTSNVDAFHKRSHSAMSMTELLSQDFHSN